eukprot:ANDGO_04529.mRNA.1 hypothetical protein
MTVEWTVIFLLLTAGCVTISVLLLPRLFRVVVVPFAQALRSPSAVGAFALIASFSAFLAYRSYEEFTVKYPHITTSKSITLETYAWGMQSHYRAQRNCYLASLCALVYLLLMRLPSLVMTAYATPAVKKTAEKPVVITPVSARVNHRSRSD